LQNVSYAGDTNLGDPVVAPFVTKSVLHLSIKAVGGSPSAITTTPVSDSALWGNVYGKAHGGVCSGVSF
jgi:simple sugar transport system substrate-binding protein/ribose transport system substrate-binding protein